LHILVDCGVRCKHSALGLNSGGVLLQSLMGCAPNGDVYKSRLLLKTVNVPGLQINRSNKNAKTSAEMLREREDTTSVDYVKSLQQNGSEYWQL